MKEHHLKEIQEKYDKLANDKELNSFELDKFAIYYLIVNHNKHEHHEKVHNDFQEELDKTNIDENIMSMNQHFMKYIEHKKDYQISMSPHLKMECEKELHMFMDAMLEIMKELKSSSDYQQERDYIKEKIRTMFNLYQ